MLEINKINLFSVKDARGVLTAVEGGVDIPFEIKRVFYMHHVVKGAARGGHAHRDTDQKMNLMSLFKKSYHVKVLIDFMQE